MGWRSDYIYRQKQKAAENELENPEKSNTSMPGIRDTKSSSSLSKTTVSSITPIKHSTKTGKVFRNVDVNTLNTRMKDLTSQRDDLVYQGRFDMYNNPYQSKINDLNKQLSSLKTDLKSAELSQKYNSLINNLDYKEKSQSGIDFKNWQSDDRIWDNDYLSVNNVGGMQNFLDNSDTHDKQSVYKYLTSEEVSNYNYLYNSKGKKEAEAYIDYLYNDLDKRMTADTTQKMSQYATAHPVAASIGSVPTNIFGGVAGTASIVGQNISNAFKKNKGEAVDPVDYDTYGMLGSAMTNTLRGTVSDNLNKNGTVNIPVIGEKGLGDLYQLGMSMVDSYTLAVTGGKATNLVLGASAAASGFKNAKEKGLSDDQAFLLGGANGIFEALFEEVSIDRLLKIKDARTMGQFIENVLKQSFTEGSEEFFTTIANTVADQIISGDKSDINKSIAGYTSEGMSAEEAKKQAWKDWGSSLAWDFVGGALTGGIMGGVQTGVQTAMQNSVYNETGKQINDNGKPELLKKLAEQYGNEINIGEDPSTKQMGQAYFDLQNKYEGEYSSNIQSGISDRLMETGMDDATAEKAQTAVSKVLNNEKLGITDTKILSDKRVQSVIDEISNGSDWTNNIADKNNVVSEKAKLLNRTLNSQSKSIETENTYTPEINTEKSQSTGFSKNSEVGSISNVSVTDDGNTVLTFSDGTQKNFADVDLRDTELNDVILAASQYGSDANNMVLGYTAENASKSLSERQSADAYIRQYNNAYDYGKMGASLEYTQKSGVANMLTKEQLEMAYNTGVKAGYKETSAKRQNINELRNAGQKKQGTVNTNNLSEGTRRNLNADQKTVISFAKQLSKYSGINIAFEESAVNEKGDYTSPNGWIDGSGTIHIDINAGADNVSSDRTFLGYTLSHELTHFAEQWAPEDYKKYSDFVVNIITQNKDVSIEAMLQHKKDSYFNGELSRLKQIYPSVSEEKLKQYVTSMSDETALKEVVADGSQMILTNSDLIERLASHDKTLFEKVKDAILKIIGDIKNLYKGYIARGAEAKAAFKYLDELTDMWTNMQEKAVQSYNESENNNKYQERDLQKRKLTYDELIKKQDITLTEVSDTKENLGRKSIVEAAYKNAADTGEIDSSGMPSVFVKDIDRDVHISKAALRHGLDRRLRVQAPVIENIGQILKNSILINKAVPKKESAESSYILLGGAHTKNGSLYFASIVVNHITNEVEYIDVMYSANVKKIESAALERARASGNNPLSLTDSNISVANALFLVKDYFSDILPKDVLNHYGIERKKTGISDSLRYQERSLKNNDRERIVSLLEGSDLNAAERELLKSYKSKIEDLNKKEADYNELRLKLNEIMYMKGTRQSEIDSLTKRRDYLRNQIARQDMKLTKFESMETMKNLISKERAIAIKNYKEGREASQTREQIKKIVKDFNARLMRPTKKKYIPVSFTRMVIDFCDSINLDDPRIKSQSTKERLAKIRDTYKSYKEDSTYDYVYDEVVADMLDNLQSEIEDVPLNKMTNKQLKYLKDCMTALHKNVTQATRLFSEEYKQDIFETGKKVMTEVSEATFIHHKFTKVFDAAQDIALWQLSPDRFFSYLSGFKKDSTCDAIGRTFKNATEKKLMVQRTFTELFRNYENIKFMDSLSDTKNLVDIGLKDSMGKPVMLTRGMMLSVYKHLSSEDNKRAFAYGGFTVPEIKQYYNGKAKDAFARGNIRTLPANTELISLYEKNMEKLNELNDLQEFKDLEGTDQDKVYDIYDEIEILEEKIAKAEEVADNEIKKIRQKCEDIMTADERSFIDTTTEWYDKHSRDYINEVTLKMYGIKKAGVKNYYTIHRDASYFNTQFESMVNNITLENWGSIKDRVKSVAPLMLTDILMELQSSVQQVSSYYGYVEATRDFNRLYNIRNKDYSMSVKEAIKGKAGAGSRKFGVTGEQYIENLLTDLTGKGKKETSILEPVRRNLARATLSVNIRVALSQAASIPTAAAEVGWGTMAKGYARGWAVGFSEEKKNELAEKNVWFWQRYRGEGSTREFAEMKGGSNPVDKAWSWIDEKTNRKLLNWCQNVDVYSTAAMYNMAEVYVEDVLGIKKEAENYDKLVNDKFTDILRKTQPNYTTTERSDLLRDNRETYKILTMYKTQSNQNFNIMFESFARLSRYKSDYKNGRNEVTKADLDKAVNQCAGAITAVVIGGTITFAVLRFVANALQRTMTNYRDDDDEVTLESILTGILKDSGSAISGCFVLGSQIYDILVSKFSDSNYYGLTDSALSAVSDIIEQIANGSGDVASLTGKLLQVLGLPYRNVNNIVTGVQGYIDGIKNNNLFEFEDGAERTASMQGDRMYKAIASGDSEKYKNVYSELYDSYISEGKTEEEADSQVKSVLKKAVKSEYADSNITAEKAGDVLKQYFDYSADDVYWQLQEWDDKDFNKYNTIDEAIKSNSVTGVKKQSEYLQEHGISESAVNAHVTKTIGDMYKSGEISALEAKKRLMNISGKEEKEALKSINSWNEKSKE